jgi:hypothetical protein
VYGYFFDLFIAILDFFLRIPLSKLLSVLSPPTHIPIFFPIPIHILDLIHLSIILSYTSIHHNILFKFSFYYLIHLFYPILDTSSLYKLIRILTTLISYPLILLLQVEGLLTRYAASLASKSKWLEAVELYRRANRPTEAALLIGDIAEQVSFGYITFHYFLFYSL